MRWPCCECPPSAVSSFYLFPQSFSRPDNYIIKERASCLGCPEEIDENSEDLKVPLSVSISKYNSMSDSTHLFTLHNVGHATRQVETGWYEERGSGKNVSFLPILSVCIPAGGRRFQVQAEVWYEEDHLYQGRTQRPQRSVCPWW